MNPYQAIVNTIPVYKNKSLKNLQGERWREIPSTEGYYQVSNFGRVKALERIIISPAAPNGRKIKSKILSQYDSKSRNRYKNDYTHGLVVKFSFEGKRFAAMIRRLVYEAFVQPKTKQVMDGMYVCPLDDDGLNNRADNLALFTKRELRIYGLEKDRYQPPGVIVPGEDSRKRALRLNRAKRKRVKKYSPVGKLLATYPSLASAAKRNAVSVGCIGLCVKKKVKLIKGFVYRYEHDIYAGDLKNWQGRCKKIVQYTFKGKRIKSFPSIIEAARLLNIHKGDISRSAKKQTRQAGGFVWRFDGDIYKGEYKEILTK